jgi:pyruvate dehydrogenase E2 component (dihydrolipoamide acetyltransferase)
MEIEAPASGVLRGVCAEPGVTIPVGQTIAYIVAPNEPWQTASAEPSAAAVRVTPIAQRVATELQLNVAEVPGTGIGGRVTRADVETFARARATPASRRVAREHQIDLAAVSGTGPCQRIQARDVIAYAKATQSAVSSASRDVNETVVPLTSVRAVIAQRMSASAHSVARVTLTTEVDASEFVRWRERLEIALKDQGIEPSYTDLLVALVSRALGEYPGVNARLLDDGLHLVRDINIGIAVETERGLLVPVIRHANKKRIAEIAGEAKELIARARAGKSSLEDLSGGTFTITNLGMLEIDAFTPIINTPEVAILGVGRIVTRPYWDAHQFVPRPQMILSLAIDHRVVDGAPGARFLQRVTQLIKEPYLLLA